MAYSNPKLANITNNEGTSSSTSNQFIQIGIDITHRTVVGNLNIRENSENSLVSGLSVSDVDGNLQSVELTVSHGFLTVDLSGGAVIYDGANNTKRLILRGSTSEINNALDSLRYTPRTDYTGNDDLKIIRMDSNNVPLGDIDVAEINIFSEDTNHAPTIANINSPLTLTQANIDQYGETIANLFSGYFSDRDGDNLLGIAITSNLQANDSDYDYARTSGWQYSTDSGTSWTFVSHSGINRGTALYLDAETRLRYFRPQRDDYYGPDSDRELPSPLTIHLIDDSKELNKVASFSKHSANDFFGIDRPIDTTNIVFGDIDGDNDLDAFVGTIEERTLYYENIGTPAQPVFTDAIENPFGINNLDLGTAHDPRLLHDTDGDGDLDAYFSNVSSDIYHLENIGDSSTPLFAEAVENPFGLTKLNDSNQWNKNPFNHSFADFDGDNDLDAYYIDVEGRLKIFENVGEPYQAHFSEAQELDFVLGSNGPIPLTFADLDLDGDLDAFAELAKYDKFAYYPNVTGPSVSFWSPQIEHTEPFGLDPHLWGTHEFHFVDIDNDDDLDFLSWAHTAGNDYFNHTEYWENNPNNSSGTQHDLSQDIGAENSSISEDAIYFTTSNLEAVDINNENPDGKSVEDIFRGFFRETSGGYLLDGIVIIANLADAVSEGVWQYKTNSSSNWVDIPTDIDERSALYLDSTNNQLRFVPAKDYQGTPGALSVRLADTDIELRWTSYQPFFVEESEFNFTVGNYYSKPVFVDIDNDNDNDLFLGASDGEVLFFEDAGEEWLATSDFELGEYNPFGITNIGYASSPTFVDIDGDGDFDAFVGEFYGDTIYFENVGTSTSASFTQHQDLDEGNANPFGITNIGYYASPTFVDIDGDGDFDVFVGEVYGDTIYFENVGTPTSASFTQYQDLDEGNANPFGISNVEGWAAPAFTDIDFDGDIDAYIGSNSDEEVIFFMNTPEALPLPLVDNINISSSGDQTGINPVSVNITIPVMPINSAPINNIPTSTLTIQENSQSTAIKNINVFDIDGNLQDVHLSVSHGTLTVDDGFVAPVSDSIIKIWGSQSYINQTLATLTYTPNPYYSGNDTLSLVSVDSYETPLADTDTVAITITPEPNQAVHRLFNYSQRRHLLSTDELEIDLLTGQGDWVNEGVFQYAPTYGDAEVFRFYITSNNQHFYTASVEERDMILSHSSMQDWVFEGVAFNAYSLDQNPEDAIATFRYFNEELGIHFYSNNEEEQKIYNELSTWTNEGIAWHSDYISSEII